MTMKRIGNLFLLVLLPAILSAQTVPLNSFSNSGGAMLNENPDDPNPVHIGVIGQPIASGFIGGTMVISNLMYATDLHPPEIDFNPESLVIESGGQNIITFDATDEDQLTSRKFYYRPIGKIGNFEFVNVTSQTNNTFTQPLAAEWFDMMGMEYYIEVKDKENTTRQPAGAGSHFVYTLHPEPKIPTTLLSYGSTKNNYRVISIPFSTPEPITQIFEELGPSDKAKYRIYKYEPTGFKEYPSFTTVGRGEGYFIIMSETLSDVVLQMPEFEAPHNNQQELFELSLHPGWNLVGNPYTLDINWDDVLNFNDNPDGLGSELKIWNENAQYTNAKDLRAYQGSFVWLEGTDPLLLQIPFKGQIKPDGDGDGRTKQREGVVETWKITFLLREGDEHSQASFGMHPNAKLGFDALDDLNPPSPDRFLAINFDHPEHSQKHFVRDIVPNAREHIWEMNIPSLKNSERTLAWSIPDLSVIPSDLFLYDMEKNKVIDMKTEKVYAFPADAQRFKVVLGRRENADFHPDGITVLQPYPNPTKRDQETIFSIGLPETDQDFPVLLTLFDGVGRKVYDKTWSLGKGLHEIHLPRLEETVGELLFYQLQVGRSRYSGKLIYKP
jgi:hypothetical protein